jgi:hypothetical protein
MDQLFGNMQRRISWVQIGFWACWYSSVERIRCVEMSRLDRGGNDVHTKRASASRKRKPDGGVAGYIIAKDTIDELAMKRLEGKALTQDEVMAWAKRQAGA